MTVRSLLFATIAATAGCASSGSDDISRTVVAEPGGGGEFVVGALADSALPKGDCGMVLWTLEAERPAPIFRLIANKGGEIMLDGRLVKLALGESSGAAGFGVFESQALSAEGIEATVKVRFGLGFDGGSYLERGLLSIESAAGWRSVIPAAGIAGCRTK